MLQTKSLYAVFVAATVMCLSASANRMVTDTKRALDDIRHGVIKKAKKDGKKIRETWKIAIDVVLGAFYDKNTAKNAHISFPFFQTMGEKKYLDNLGSTQEDIDYLQSVFTEFYGSGERTMFRLVTILHRHMMAALGLHKTLDEFKKMMENTDHHHRPKSLNSHQFEIYRRCVGRGLFAVYWFEHGQN